jgi:hypothetical protein
MNDLWMASSELLGSELFRRILKLKYSLQRQNVIPTRVELGQRQSGLITAELMKGLPREEGHELLPGIMVPVEAEVPDWALAMPEKIHGLTVELHDEPSLLRVVGHDSHTWHGLQDSYPGPGVRAIGYDEKIEAERIGKILTGEIKSLPGIWLYGMDNGRPR